MDVLWEGLEETEINVEEFDEMFAKPVVKKKTAQEKPKEKKKTKEVEVFLSQ